MYHCDEETRSVKEGCENESEDDGSEGNVTPDVFTTPNTSVTAGGDVFENLGPDLVVLVRCSSRVTKGVPPKRLIAEDKKPLLPPQPLKQVPKDNEPAPKAGGAVETKSRPR